MIYKTVQFMAKTPQARADEMIFRTRLMIEEYGVPDEIRTGYADGNGLALWMAELPDVPLVHDHRPPMANQYWFGYKDLRKREPAAQERSGPAPASRPKSVRTPAIVQPETTAPAPEAPAKQPALWST